MVLGRSIKGTWTKPKGDMIKGGKWGSLGWGEKGERFSGTTIKGTWTKPKGVRIKGGKWGWLRKGESGDNCT